MPQDTADHIGYAFVLPPGFMSKDVNRIKCQSIDESDRMTLKFIKNQLCLKRSRA